MNIVPVLPLTIVVDQEAAINHNVMIIANSQNIANIFASSEVVAEQMAKRLSGIRRCRIIAPYRRPLPVVENEKQNKTK